jgi:hypothetical protein
MRHSPDAAAPKLRRRNDHFNVFWGVIKAH